MRKKIDNLFVDETTKIVDAMMVMDQGGAGIAFVCKGTKLISVITDGDVRRHILKGKPLEVSVVDVGNSSFKSLPETSTRSEAVQMMKKLHIDCIPVVDDMGVLLGAYFINDVFEKQYSDIDIPVVIMAGGKGTRLYPYTKVLPKPLIPIGDKTITEHIMDSFIHYNCTEFNMIVNHKKNMIKAFFADEALDYDVRFFDEDIPLGTGGGLGLLRDCITSTFFMSNCDVLIFEDYANIVNYHKQHKNILTMVCATKSVTIPYGTITLDKKGHVKSMEEKPSFSFLTNSGLYIIEPEFFNYIPENQFIHITDIIQKCIDNGENVGTYPISESQWSDMGQLEEMEKMKERLGG